MLDGVTFEELNTGYRPEGRNEYRIPSTAEAHTHTLLLTKPFGLLDAPAAAVCGMSHLGQGRSALGLLSSLDRCSHLAVKVDLDQGLDLVPVLDHGVWRVQSGDGGVCDCASSCLRWLSRRCRILVCTSCALLQAASIPSPPHT